uniref:Uncharacterized protein n=1 Tax=Glossina pallidipes TaxID=7398 RepID=A0A1B0AG04_GLOPL
MTRKATTSPHLLGSLINFYIRCRRRKKRSVIIQIYLTRFRYLQCTTLWKHLASYPLGQTKRDSVNSTKVCFGSSVESLPFDGTKSVIAVSDVGMEVPSIRVLPLSGSSLNKAYSSGSSRSGGVIVGYEVGSKSREIQGAKFSKRATTKNNNFEVGCNELAAGRQVEMTSDQWRGLRYSQQWFGKAA